MTRREHIEQLAAELGATLIYEGARYRMAANVITGEILLAPWDGDVPESELYWTALHELGHWAEREEDWPWRRLQHPELEADNEARAWLWAIEHSEFDFEQAAESMIAWGIADRIFLRGFEPTEALRRLYELLGPDPDWYFNVTEPSHWAKLEGYAKPAWAKLAAHYEKEAADAGHGTALAH